MIAEISSPSTGSNDSEFGKETWRYFEKFPSPMHIGQADTSSEVDVYVRISMII